MKWAELGKPAVFFHNGGASETFIGDDLVPGLPAGRVVGHVPRRAVPAPLLRRQDRQAARRSSPRSSTGKEVDRAAAWWTATRRRCTRRRAKHPAAEGQPQDPGLQPEAGLRRLGRRGHPPARRACPGSTATPASPKLDAEAQSVSVVDFDNDGKPDLCLCGANKVVLLQNGGDAFSEVGAARPRRRCPVRGVGRLQRRRPARPAARHARRPAAVHEPRQGPVPRRHAGSCRRKPRTTSPPPPGATSTATASRTSSSPTASTACGCTGTTARPTPSPRPPRRSSGRLARRRPVPRRQHGTEQLRHRLPARDGDAVRPRARRTRASATCRVKWAEEGATPTARSTTWPSSAATAPRTCTARSRCEPPTEVPVSFGSDDTLTVWLNGEKVVSENVNRACAGPGRAHAQAQAGQEPPAAEDLQRATRAYAFYFQPRPGGGPAADPWFEDVSDAWGLGRTGWPRREGRHPRRRRLQRRRQARLPVRGRHRHALPQHRRPFVLQGRQRHQLQAGQGRPGAVRLRRRRPHRPVRSRRRTAAASCSATTAPASSPT